MNKKKIFILAAEASADAHGSELLSELIPLLPDGFFRGIGGAKMCAFPTFQSILPFHLFQVMGLTQIIRHLPKMVYLFYKIKKYILKNRFDLVVLIDYPEFNLRLARSLRKSHFLGKIVCLIPPTVWAWREDRIHFLRNFYDAILSIFPFEKEFYAQKGMSIHYIGFPLAEKIRSFNSTPSQKIRYTHWQNQKIIALFPGSRFHEIETNLPTHIQAALLFYAQHPKVIFVISAQSQEKKEKIIRILNHLTFHERKIFEVIEAEDNYFLMQQAYLAIATSGTVTTELGLFHVPTVVTYHLSSLNYWLAAYLFRIQVRYISIVNYLLQQPIFPELIYYQFTPEKVYQELETLFATEKHDHVVIGLKQLWGVIEEKKSGKEAALTIYQMLKSSQSSD